MRKKKTITLKEIAKKCGVSVATASFVLNNKNKKGISSTTWNKIEKVFLKYGCKKNKNSVKRIIFFMESQSHLATTRFLRGIDIEVLHNNEFIFLFNKISDNIDNINKVINKYHPDGMILATGRTKELSLDLKKVNINKVLLNCWTKNFNGVSILPNEYFSTKDIIKNLIDRKKNNIAIILPQEYWWQAYEDRLSGWRDAYIESGFIINRNLICRPIRKKNMHPKLKLDSYLLKNL